MAFKKNQWAPLKEGDTVDLVAPGFRCTDQVLQESTQFLAGWGLEPRVSKKVFGRDILSANSDSERFRQLKEALCAPDSKAVWCLRGGYGSLRLMPELIKLKKPSLHPKLFIGLSDITSIQVHLGQAWGWPTIHGPLLDRLGKGLVQPRYERELKRFVFGELPEIEFSKLKPLNQAARKPGLVSGEVTGGNLVTLQSSIGTKAEWQPRGKILFFEEIGERGYKVDRILEHFHQLGIFKNAKAVVLGEFIGGHETDGKTLVPQVLKRFAEALAIPVFSGVRSGHGVVQRPLPFGTPAKLHLGSVGHLICQSGCLE